jgi:hypothetical protein
MKREDNLQTILEIVVNRKNLSDGTKANCSECPVALAVKRAVRLAGVQGFEVCVRWNVLLQIFTKTERTQHVPMTRKWGDASRRSHLPSGYADGTASPPSLFVSA